jgi:hypothetical protein
MLGADDGRWHYSLLAAGGNAAVWARAPPARLHCTWRQQRRLCRRRCQLRASLLRCGIVVVSWQMSWQSKHSQSGKLGSMTIQWHFM